LVGYYLPVPDNNVSFGKTYRGLSPTYNIFTLYFDYIFDRQRDKSNYSRG
jgi:hypothetical protein